MSLFTINIDARLQGLTDFFLEMTGNGFDPQGSPLPAFRAHKPPSIEPPRKAPKKAAQVDSDGIYTDEEIEAMSDVEFALRIGGARTKHEFYKKDTAQARKAPIRAVEFDEVDMDDHGITPREYGEMRAYVPTLTDLALAAKVKKGKTAGKSLRKIAEETKQTYQTVRHYSAALGRAQD